MTRNEFLDDVTTFGELKDFCSDNGCNLLDDVYDEESRDDYVNDCLAEWAHNNSWEELRDILNEIPTGYDWYLDDYGSWDGLDDEDFENCKNDVLEWADDNDIWEDDEEGDEEDSDYFEDESEDDEPAPEEEDFSVGDLIGMCVAALGAIQSEDTRRVREEEEEFRRLYPKVLR